MTPLGLAPAVAILVLAGCGKPASPGTDATRGAADASAPATSAEVSPGLPDSGSGGEGIVTMRYACEQGHRVAIVGGHVARVTLADGRNVEIARIEGSAPPRYSGEALSFEVGSSGAVLGQDETGGFACREA